MDLSEHGKWKKSKVESFIRRHLNNFDLGMTRYYEMCMWDNKGTLQPTYAILMDKSIVLTENPPKTIIYTIPFSTINNISLIADRHSLIRGKNNNAYICQHISIVYESKSKKAKGNNHQRNGEVDKFKGARPSSSLYQNDEDCESEIYEGVGSLSESSASPAPSSLNESFRSSLILSAYNQHQPAIKMLNNNWLSSLESIRMKENEMDERYGKNYNVKERRKGLMKELNYEVRNGNGSSPERWKSRNSRRTQELSVFSSRPSHSDSSDRNSDNSAGKGSEGLFRRYRSSESSNLTTSDSHARKKRETEKTFEKFENIQLYFYQRDSEFLNELSLVWNRQQLKNTEREEENFMGLAKTAVVNKSLRAAEKIASRVAQQWHYVDGVEESLTLSNRKLTTDLEMGRLLRKVGFLHKCLKRYEHLKYLCWKDSVIMSGLINAVTECLEPIDSENAFSVEEAYLDKLATYALLMDIFRTLFEACSLSWFKESESVSRSLRSSEDFSDWETDIWDEKLTIFDVTQKLLVFILSSPFIPQECDVPTSENGFGAMVDTRKYPWLTLDDESSAKVAGLICTAHNASAALLFELLAISHFLPKFTEQALVTSGIQKMKLEHFVRLSVTQIVNILWSSNDPMTASQTLILYRQVWNLRTLVKHDVKILHFIRHNFSEEFHYYVRSKGIKSRIPDQYTIKAKVIDACEKLCEDIVGK